MKCLLNQIVKMMGLEGVGDIYSRLWQVIDPINPRWKNACFLFRILEVFLKTCWSLGGRISLNLCWMWLSQEPGWLLKLWMLGRGRAVPVSVLTVPICAGWKLVHEILKAHAVRLPFSVTLLTNNCQRNCEMLTNLCCMWVKMWKRSLGAWVLSVFIQLAIFRRQTLLLLDKVS